MGIEGEFNYTNGALIESSIAENRKDAVCRHEAEHGILYTTTTFGQLILMLEKNALFHNNLHSAAFQLAAQIVMKVLFTFKFSCYN